MSAWVLTGDRTLIYQWEIIDNDEAKENAPIICAMARLMTSLGDVQDTVYARGEMVNYQSPSIQSTEERIVYLPHPQTDGNWESPDVGSLIGYQNRYRSMLQAATREFSPAAINYPVKSRRVHYSTQEIIRSDAPMALFELWRNEDERLPYDPRDLRQPAAMVRHTMIEWLETRDAFRNRYGAELTSRLVAGHASDKQHSTQFNGAHIACVPIPTMREEGVYDGLIRRVLLIGFGCEEKETIELFESVTDGINGAALKDQSVKVGYLKKTSLNDSVLRLFTRKAYRVWRTVTPIILTGLMRRGRGAEVLIARALKQAGLNENDIESIATFSGPVVPKTVHALDYRIDKNSHLAQTPRYHAEVIFKRPVIGPLVVGRGRHSGFGLMMPCLEKPPDDLK
jgi:CRISPR-associated protein Csb2